MITLFGLTIASEVFASHSDFIRIDTFSKPEVIQADLTAPDTEDSNCGDPCHLGQCHFGHCSFSFAENSINLYAIDRMTLGSTLAPSAFNPAFLAGLRRPPRFV